MAEQLTPGAIDPETGTRILGTARPHGHDGPVAGQTVDKPDGGWRYVTTAEQEAGQLRPDTEPPQE